jgi:enterochelin esterase-like enzyme
MDDLQINELVTRLSRPHPSGGVVIERAAILAAGADSPAVIDWIIAHSGTPDTAVRAVQGRGLHGSRMNDDGGSTPQKPLRFVLPAGSLS